MARAVDPVGFDVEALNVPADGPVVGDDAGLGPAVVAVPVTAAEAVDLVEQNGAGRQRGCPQVSTTAVDAEFSSPAVMVHVHPTWLHHVVDAEIPSVDDYLRGVGW